MKQRMLLTVIRGVLRALGTFSPSFAGRKAFAMFCTPPKARPLSERGAALFARGERHEIYVNGDVLRVYRWANVNDMRRGRVLLAHGWGSRAARFRPWIERLLEQGYDVLAIDAPAHGESQGRRMTVPAYVSALRQTTQEFGPVDALVGHSLGGMAAAFASASANLFAGEPLRAGAMVLVAAPSRVSLIVEHFADFLRLSPRVRAVLQHHVEQAAGGPLDRFDLANVLKDATMPILVMHDRDDDEVRFAAARAIAEAAGARLESSSGLGHHKVLSDPKQVQVGVAFIEQRLVDRAAA